MYLQILVLLLSYLLTSNAVFAQQPIGKILNMTCPKNSFSLIRNGQLYPEEIKRFSDLFVNDSLILIDEQCAMILEVGGKEIKLGKDSGFLSLKVKNNEPSVVNNVITEVFKIIWDGVFGVSAEPVQGGSERGTGKLTIPLFAIIENEGEMATLVEKKKKLFLNWRGDLSPYRVRIKDHRGKLVCKSKNTHRKKVMLSFSRPIFRAGKSYWVEVESQHKKCKKGGTKAAKDCKDKGKFKVVGKNAVPKNQAAIDNLIQFAEEHNFRWLFEAYQQVATLKKNHNILRCR